MPFYLSSDLDKPRFLKRPNVPAPQKFLITAFAMENVGRGEMKPVLHFSNTELGFILNPTNRRAIAEKLGDNMLAWPGHVIVIFPALVEFDNRMVPGLRVRVPKQKDPPPHVATAQAPLTPTNGNGAAHPTPDQPLHDPSHDDELAEAFDRQLEYAEENARLMGEEINDDDTLF
jgi:hypothetical protein